MKRIIYGWYFPFIAAFLVVLVLYLFFSKNVCIVDGSSMNPSFHAGQHLLLKSVDRIRRNEVFVVKNPLLKSNNNLTLKRCVALPGDTVSIADKQLYVNGKAQQQSFCQFNRRLMLFNEREKNAAISRYGILTHGCRDVITTVPTTDFLYNRILRDSIIQHISTDIKSPELHDRCLYPFSMFYAWNRDFYGPIVVPGRGVSIRMTIGNYVLYKSLIVNYEGKSVEYKNGVCHIDGAEAPTYTFTRDYYFFLNDYRDDVSDSRTFGPLVRENVVQKYFATLSILPDRK